MTSIQVLSFLDTLQKTAFGNPRRERLSERLKSLLSASDRKAAINQGNWNYSGSPMVPDYPNTDVPPA